MYNCSQAFHTAVKNGEPQKALLIFNDCVFTDGDIDVDKGIEFNDYFNTEEDICIGQALSNEISFTLFNDDRLLNNYTFGQFTALLGVRVEVKTYSQIGTVTCVVGNTLFTADSRQPYLRMNGIPVSSQPSQRIASMLAYDGKLYCFGVDGNYCAIYTTNGSPSTGSVNAFMKNKAAKQWNGKGMSYTNKNLHIWQGGVDERYEFVPLGVFIAKRPNAPDQIQIDMTCNDLMVLFDKKYDLDPTGILSEDFANLARSVGIPYKIPTEFINDNPDGVPIKYEDFENVNKRDVLKWIAEASCTNARIDRDGYLVLDWLHSTSQAYSEHDYVDFTPYWYQTQRLGRVYYRTTDNGIDAVYGASGADRADYLIQDNPYFRWYNDETKIMRIRAAKQSGMSTEEVKLSYCLTEDGYIDYDKVVYMPEDASKWKEASDKWDEEHPVEPVEPQA